jgi:anti-sigma regulatory factor (Ser/Thr protein kinase)
MSGRDITADGPAEVLPESSPGSELFPAVDGLTHVAIFYDGAVAPGAVENSGAEDSADQDGGRLGSTGALFLAAAGNCPVFVLVSARMRRALQAAPSAHGARFDDMADLGRNPARIIPAGHSFLDQHPGEHAYCLWEPAWPSRSAAELQEVARHEALVNLAFERQPMTVACLYDTSSLPAGVLRDAERTHPDIISGDRRQASGSYLEGEFPPGCDDPLPPAARDAASISFDGYLGPVREFSGNQAQAAGLDRARAGDLVLAVSEIAANALGHAAGGGIVRSWCTDDEMICQIEDLGHITDPLAGRRRQPAEAAGGHGLWLVNRVCDLVERRTGEDGTITRLHMRRTAG